VARGREGKRDWSYFVGLEGGLDLMVPPAAGRKRDTEETQRIETLAAVREPLPRPRLVFLQNWAYVTDGSRGAFGQSGSILLPEALAARVVDGGVELAKAIDDFAGGKGIRDAQGAWGVFTRNMITRQDAFRTAVINAFAPFFNATLYRSR
jgi:non-canonical (house-cleaning) NTP pyrophosphatase